MSKIRGEGCRCYESYGEKSGGFSEDLLDIYISVSRVLRRQVKNGC
jgi:hypothetical protein